MEIIKNIIEKLKNTEYNFDKESEYLDEIVNLPVELEKEIIDYVSFLSENIDEDNEYYFVFLLDALHRRGSKKAIFDLGSKAILSDEFEDKEFYATLLIKNDFLGTEKILIKSLEIIESFDEFGGYAQEKILEYLIEKEVEEAYPQVIKCLSDVAARVRATALHFIRKFDKQESSLYLVEMLEAEDWEYNILFILDLLKKWKKADFLPQIIEYSKEEWVKENIEINDAFKNLINHLST
ncbi:hypothetical protein AD998_13040 [bacterium 336/3]|nr:hypothetical protein AD998_13040 [bacterium 336/3]